MKNKHRFGSHRKVCGVATWCKNKSYECMRNKFVIYIILIRDMSIIIFIFSTITWFWFWKLLLKKWRNSRVTQDGCSIFSKITQRGNQRKWYNFSVNSLQDTLRAVSSTKPERKLIVAQRFLGDLFYSLFQYPPLPVTFKVLKFVKL